MKWEDVKMANAGVMGAGSWGTALALLLHKNGHRVKIGRAHV